MNTSMSEISLLVLAAGRGSRLGTATADLPKWLLPVAGRTIANRQADAIGEWQLEGFQKRLVVSGYQAGMVAAFLADFRPEFDVIVNRDWARANNWLSLLLGLQTIYDGSFAGDVIVVNGDVLVPRNAFRRLAGDERSGHVKLQLLVDFDADLTDESMKTSVRRRGDSIEVTGIGKRDVGSAEAEFVGISRLSYEGAGQILQILRTFGADSGSRDNWYEHAYERMIQAALDASKDIEVEAVPINGEAWVEIDSPQDLAVGEAMVLNAARH